MDSGYSWDGSTNELGVKSIDQYCHGPECSGSRRAPVESMAVVQSPWRPWTPTDSHAKEERAHMRGGAAKKRTKLKEHADGYHSGAREIRAKGTITGRRRRSSV